jgi:anti-sigma regulatory factor (Ser/Thr protein kinase)
LKERIVLAPAVMSPKRARDWVSTRCGSNPEVISTAELLVSELVANAVVHAKTEMVVSICRQASVVRVEVEDGGPGLPTLPRGGDPVPTGDSGRGLRIVSELASSWGVRVTPEGKAVWFELAIR